MSRGGPRAMPSKCGVFLAVEELGLDLSGFSSFLQNFWEQNVNYSHNINLPCRGFTNHEGAKQTRKRHQGKRSGWQRPTSGEH